eukprot:m.28452 g.28452  ORF g.28452 m.28452 type:complete len:327 (+) comp10447_c1_seq1:280-1260(+)
MSTVFRVGPLVMLAGITCDLAAAQTTIIKQGTEIDWEFAFIVAASVAAFLFLILIAMTFYLKLTINAQKTFMNDRAFGITRTHSRTLQRNTSASTSRTSFQDVPSLSMSLAPTISTSVSRNTTRQPSTAWSERREALDNLTDAEVAVEEPGEDFLAHIQKTFDTFEVGMESKSVANSTNHVNTQGVSSSNVTLQPAHSAGQLTQSSGITGFDFGDEPVEPDAMADDDEGEWPMSDSDASDDLGQYDFTNRESTLMSTGSTSVRLITGTKDDTAVEVQLSANDGDYVDIQAVSRSANSTAHSQDPGPTVLSMNIYPDAEPGMDDNDV